MSSKPLSDEDKMPFGKFKGIPMADVTASYLDWLHGQPWIKDWPEVLGYIEANRSLIDKELGEQGRA